MGWEEWGWGGRGLLTKFLPLSLQEPKYLASLP